MMIKWKNMLAPPRLWLTYSLKCNRRKFRSQTSDHMDRWKAEQGRGREKRKIRRKKSRRERVRRKKMQMREKVGKVAKHCVFTMICGSGGSKSRLAKAAAAEPAGQMSDEKIARRCGAKHIWKSKCTKHTILGPLLQVEMSKKCTPLWREAHFQVKMYKTHHARTTFGSCDVEKVHAVLARSTFPSQNVQNTTCSRHFGGSDVEKVHAVVARSRFRSENAQNTPCSDHFWRFRCRFASLQYTTLHYTSLRYTTLH